MGLQLCTPVGSIIMHKFLIASCLAVATLASAEADADAGLLVVPVVPAVHTNALVGSGGISPAWPATRALGLDSTCYGCRPLAAVHVIHKREAEAEADPYYGYGYLAAPLYRYGPGIALHPGVATSFVARSPQGLGKGSADAEPGVGVVVGHTVGLGLNHIHGLSHFGYGHGISQLHPTGHSFQAINRLTRGRLRLSLRLRLMLRLILTTDTDTPVWDTMDMVWDTMVMVWDTTAMVLDTMVMDTDMDTDSDTTDKMEAFNCACAFAIRTSE